MDKNIKTIFQERELSALYGKPRVILKWATGCGKSKATINLVNHASKGMPVHPVKALFVVAERAHKKNWEDEFRKWKLMRGIDVKMICYASLHKEEHSVYDILVLDEAHHAFTEKRLNILKTISSAYVYLLSATLSSAKTDEMENTFGKFTTSTVTLKDAINQDLLPNPKVYVIGMELDDKNVNQTIQIGKDPNAKVIPWEDRAKYIYRGAPCIIKCTEKQKYLYLTDSMEYWKHRYELSRNPFHHNKWVNLGSQRKRYLGELKTEAVRKLLNTFPRRKRYVCFCASINQANSLSKANTVSSKKGSSKNQDIIDAFNAKKTHSLYAVGMITEGMNLKDIEVGVIVQLDGKERLFIQKAGRVLRAEMPVMYIFYYKNTQDENYLNGAFDNIDSKFVKYCDQFEFNSQL